MTGPSEPVAEPSDATTLPPSRRSYVRFTVAAVVIALAIAFIAILQRQRIAAPLTQGSEAHGAIALVLPVVVSAGSGYDWVRLGLMDLIGARLRAAGLAVVPSDNVVALTGRLADNASPETLARAVQHDVIGRRQLRPQDRRVEQHAAERLRVDARPLDEGGGGLASDPHEPRRSEQSSESANACCSSPLASSSRRTCTVVCTCVERAARVPVTSEAAVSDPVTPDAASSDASI